MKEIPSKVEGMQFDLFKLEEKLKPIGYIIGGNWDYDHGTFDYKLNDEGSYEYLRLPFTALDGQLDAINCTVELGRPFLLSHQYEAGIDEQGESGTFSSSFNQFQEPVDKDAHIPEHYLSKGKELVAQLEAILLTD